MVTLFNCFSFNKEWYLVEMALNKLHVNKENVISIGDSIIDREMSKNGEVKFLGAIWDSQEVEELKTGEIIDSPLGILKYI